MSEKNKGIKSKAFLTGMLAGMAVIVAANFGLQFYNGYKPGVSQQSTSSSTNAEVNAKINRLYDILDRAYVDGYDKTDTVESMYAGLVNGIGDPYTVYMTTEQYERFSEDTEGIYAGIGVVVSVDKFNRIIVVSPFEGSPGANAGIQPKDCIIKVNGTEVFGDMLDDAVKMMKGTPGTSVTVTLYRESDTGEAKTFDVDIVREIINMPTVSHKMLENDIGYIRITGFERVTLDQFKEAYNDLQAQKMKGLILDLRNNPGGLLDVVVKITDMLVPEGTIVYTIDKNGKKLTSESDTNCIKVPLLVLVNGNSASASEVLSGAVKDMGVGKLVGETTFGKGLVQNIFEVGDGSAVKVTIARYYTPSGVCIQGTGIEPNYPVPMNDELTVNISSLTLDEDVQLSEAISIMKDSIK